MIMDEAQKLMVQYSEILRKLNSFDIVRTYGNPVGDYTEFLVKSKLGLILSKTNSTGYDAYDEESNVTYQIKGRWERGKASIKSREFGIIRDYNLQKPTFDYLIAVIFDEHFDVKEAYKIKYADVPKYGIYRERENGYKIRLIGKEFEKLDKENITNLLK